jgi:hypothetical protein
MPLTANFLADFSSFINACASATASTAEVEAAGDKLAGSFTQSVQTAAGSLQTVGSGIADFGHKAWEVLSGPELKEFGHAVTEFAGEYIHEFAAAEQATVRLEQSLKNAGQTSPTIAKDYAEMAEALQKVSTYSHIAITDAQAVFTTIGKVGPENMQATLEAAMNLAAFMRIDVVDAAKLMEKAAASDGSAIGRLKIALGDAYQKGMDFNEIVAAISKKFGGQFAADLETTNGKLENMKNQMADVNELIGKQMAASMTTMLEAFHKLPEGMQTFLIGAHSISEGVEPVLSAFGNLAQVLGTLFPASLAAAGAAIAEFVAGLVGWPVVIIAAIAALAVGIYKYWDEIVAYLKGVTERIKQYMMVDQPAAFNSSVEAVAKWFYGVKYWIQDQFGALVDWIVKKIPEITAAFKLAADAIVLHSIVPDLINGVGVQFSKLQDLMVTPAWDAATQTIAAFNSIQMPNAFSTMTMPDQAVKFANVFSSTSGLTENAPGTVITLNMTGMLGTDDPQTRQIMSDLVSNAVMQGMRNGRLLGTT